MEQVSKIHRTIFWARCTLCRLMQDPQTWTQVMSKERCRVLLAKRGTSRQPKLLKSEHCSWQREACAAGAKVPGPASVELVQFKCAGHKEVSVLHSATMLTVVKVGHTLSSYTAVNNRTLKTGKAFSSIGVALKKRTCFDAMKEYSDLWMWRTGSGSWFGAVWISACYLSCYTSTERKLTWACLLWEVRLGQVVE